ncbi:MAG: SDR family oxidoreductase, partial [Pseudomonadota bacterium]
MTHPAIAPGAVATITGGGAGIGRAAAMAYATAGMNLVLIDRRAELLDGVAAEARAAGAPDVVTAGIDVTDRAALSKLETEVAERFGGTDILMNNAGIGVSSSIFAEVGPWEATLGVNLWGIIHGCQVFGPRMIARGRPGAIINTGSKQGITTPPGNPAYNVSKAGVKAFTEAMAHELRNTPGHAVTAHLLIPGFVFTDMT